MSSLMYKFNSITNKYNMVTVWRGNDGKAYRCELTQKYSQAATGYLDFLTEGILFLEEHKRCIRVESSRVVDLPANLYCDMKRLLGAANERMEMLKRRGYTPRTQNPAPANAVHTSVPSPTPAASPKPAASGNPSHPVANSPAEQVQPASPTSQSSIRYECDAFRYDDA